MTDAAPDLLRRNTCMVLVLVLIGACSWNQPRAPVSRVPVDPASKAGVPRGTASAASGVHQVRRGETLYAIAWRYGTDYRQLARINAISSPYTIYPGQRLRLKPLKTAKRKASKPRSSAGTKRAAPKKPASAKRKMKTRAKTRAKTKAKTKTKNASPKTTKRRVESWRWPTEGKLIGRFGSAGGKGIDISGRPGQQVVASAPGRVVYSGSGLRGYGKLIIIKHNDRFLSAYAHNEKLHVKEGDSVVTGQRIAQMGQSDAKRTKLHFEIRRDGKPVDPLKYLPG